MICVLFRKDIFGNRSFERAPFIDELFIVKRIKRKGELWKSPTERGAPNLPQRKAASSSHKRGARKSWASGGSLSGTSHSSSRLTERAPYIKSVYSIFSDKKTAPSLEVFLGAVASQEVHWRHGLGRARMSWSRRSWRLGRGTVVGSIFMAPRAFWVAWWRRRRASGSQVTFNASWMRDEAREIDDDLRIPQLKLRRDQSLHRSLREARPTIRREPHRGGVPIAVFFSRFPFKLRRGPPAASGDLPIVFAVNVNQAEGVS